MIRSLATGRIVAASLDTVYEPQQRAGRNPMVYLHGANGDGSQAAGNGFPSIANILTVLTSRLFAPVSTSLTDSFGNALSNTRINEAILWARNNVVASSNKVILLGASMGSIGSFNFAYLNPTLVACIVAFLPVPDVQYLRDTNFLGTRPMIDAAWGITYPAVLPAGANPISPASMAVLANIPIHLAIAPNDLASTNYDAFVTGTGAEVQLLSPFGHSDAAIATADVPAIVNFIESNI